MTEQSSPAVETLQQQLDTLVLERERLRSSSAERSELERNRLAIVRVQWELSRALIARYRPTFQAA